MRCEKVCADKRLDAVHTIDTRRRRRPLTASLRRSALDATLRLRSAPGDRATAGAGTAASVGSMLRRWERSSCAGRQRETEATENHSRLQDRKMRICVYISLRPRAAIHSSGDRVDGCLPICLARFSALDWVGLDWTAGEGRAVWCMESREWLDERLDGFFEFQVEGAPRRTAPPP